MSQSNDALILGGVEQSPTVIVLMCNDAVLGVYTSESKAEEASSKFLEARYKETWRCPSYIDRRKREGEEEFKRHIRSTLYIHNRYKRIDDEANI